MSTVTTQSTDALGPRSRSQRLRKSLLQAFGGGRAIALTGQPGDVLVATDGTLLRFAQWLALEEASRGSAVLNVDARRGSALIVLPGSPPAIDNFKLPAGPIASLLVEIINRLNNCDQPVTILIDFCCLELDADDGTLLRWLLEVPGQPGLSNRGHRVVACFPTAPPPPSRPPTIPR